MTDATPGQDGYDAVRQGVPVAIVSGTSGALGASLDALTVAEGLVKTSVDALTAALAPSTAIYTVVKTAPISSGNGSACAAQACKSVMLQNPATNVGISIFWGSDATHCLMEIVPGAYSPAINVSDASLIFVKSGGAACPVNVYAKN